MEWTLNETLPEPSQDYPYLFFLGDRGKRVISSLPVIVMELYRPFTFTVSFSPEHLYTQPEKIDFHDTDHFYPTQDPGTLSTRTRVQRQGRRPRGVTISYTPDDTQVFWSVHCVRRRKTSYHSRESSSTSGEEIIESFLSQVIFK